jgi:branched-subunit amino acid ABC-type transport system permease component
MPDPSFIFAQSLSGLTAAMFLFLIASGLSLIFGVLRVLNFAHGSFYMLGAYGAYQFVQWIGMGPGRFWWAVIGAALGVAVLGGSWSGCSSATCTPRRSCTSSCSPMRSSSS